VLGPNVRNGSKGRPKPLIVQYRSEVDEVSSYIGRGVT
jgi:hypothetical protein